MPRQAEISDQRYCHKGIAQQAHEHARAAHRIEILALEDVDQASRRECTRGYRDPDQVEDYPQAPGVSIRQMRATAQAEREPRDYRNNSECHERQHEPIEWSHQRVLNGLKLRVVVVVPSASVRSACGCNGYSAFDSRVSTGKKGAYRHHSGGNGMESRPGECRIWFIADVGEAELLKRYRR